MGRSKLALLCAIRVLKNVPKKIKLAYKFQNSMVNLYSIKWHVCSTTNNKNNILTFRAKLFHGKKIYKMTRYVFGKMQSLACFEPILEFWNQIKMYLINS